MRRGFYTTEEDQKESEGKRVYFRVLEVDANDESSLDKIRGIFATCLHNLAMRAVIESPPEEGSPVAEMIDSFKKLPNLHFAEE